MTCSPKITPGGKQESNRIEEGDSCDEKGTYGREIVGIMRGYEGSGVTVKEYCRTKGIHAGDVLRLEEAVWVNGGGRDAGVAEFAGGEREIEAAAGGA